MLRDDIAAFLPQLRREAEARMTSRADVVRRTGNAVEVNGYEVDEWGTVHAGIPFRSGPGSSSSGGSRGVSIGGVTFEDATGVGHMPAGTGDLADDDLILVRSGEWAGDTFRIVAAVRYDQQTARRVPIVEESRPEGLA